jgi:hypothetical protein
VSIGKNLIIQKVVASRMRRRGNMLLIVAGASMIIAGLGIWTIDQMIAFGARENLQSFTDGLCLAAAVELNAGDKIGKINNLVADSRQLVDLTRQFEDDCEEQHSPLGALASELDLESSAGARIVESERVTMQRLTIEHVQRILRSASTNRDLPGPLRQAESTGVKECHVGWNCLPLSNVVANKWNERLFQEDVHLNFIEPLECLYRAKLDLRLPDQRERISFLLSPIWRSHATGSNQAALARSDLSKNETAIVQSFQEKPVSLDFFPTTVRLTARADLRTPLFVQLVQLEATSTAISNGAGGWPCD